MHEPSKSLIGLQIMRGVAASLVLWHHCLEEAAYVRYAAAPPDWLIRLGAAGVDIFFVISGFIMMYTSFAPGRHSPTPAKFLQRRFLRIYPLYWVCCGLVLGLHALGFFQAAKVAPDYVANSLLLLPLRGGLLLSPAWTLVYEVYFYVLFAAALRSRDARWTLFGTTALIALLYSAAPWLPKSELRKFLMSEIVFEFCFGAGLGYLTATGWRASWRPLRYAWIPASVFAIIATCQLPSPTTANPATDMQRLFIWGIPSTWLVLSAAHWQPSLHSPVMRGLLLLGDASYSIYLTHAFVMVSYAVVLRKLPWLAAMNQWPVTTAVFVAATTLGVIVHLTVEKTLTRVTHRRHRAKSLAAQRLS
jgi:exopolysaccharide production protein ExoZ